MTSTAGKERSAQEAENNQQYSTGSNRSTPHNSPLSVRKSVQGMTSESKKSAAERFRSRELQRQNGFRTRSLDGVDAKNKGKSTKLISTETVSTNDTPSKENSKPEGDDWVS